MAAGIETGVYFFAQAITVEEAIEEAEFVLELLEGHEIDGPVAYDWEMHDSSYRVYGTTPEMATACAVAFCERIEEAGYDAMVYAGTVCQLHQIRPGGPGALSLLVPGVQERILRAAVSHPVLPQGLLAVFQQLPGGRHRRQGGRESAVHAPAVNARRTERADIRPRASFSGRRDERPVHEKSEELLAVLLLVLVLLAVLAVFLLLGLAGARACSGCRARSSGHLLSPAWVRWIVSPPRWRNIRRRWKKALSAVKNGIDKRRSGCYTSLRKTKKAECIRLTSSPRQRGQQCVTRPPFRWFVVARMPAGIRVL